jgi:hypothetical protein
VDYPLEGFHDVASCYQHNGWQVVSERRENLTDTAAPLAAFRDVLQRSSCQHALLYHAVLNEHGQWLLPPMRKSALALRVRGADPAMFQTSYRIQCLTGAYAAVPPQVADSLRELFVETSGILSRQLMGQFSTRRNP